MSQGEAKREGSSKDAEGTVRTGLVGMCRGVLTLCMVVHMAAMAHEARHERGLEGRHKRDVQRRAH